MESKERTVYLLIILFFIIGVVTGYLLHQPGTEIRYINRTIEVPGTVATIAATTTIPVKTTPQPTPTQAPDFVVRVYDPEKDKPVYTIELINWKAMPDEISIRPGEPILIKVVDYPEQEPPYFIMGSYERKLGTAGQIIVIFNKTGTYNFQVIIPSNDPTINPTKYADGSIRVY